MNTNEELFNQLRAKFSDLTMGDEDAQSTTDPKEAQFFTFEYKDHPVSVTLGENELSVYYSRQMTENQPMQEKTEWFEFIQDIRKFAKSRNLGFDVRDISKSNLEKKDYKYLAQNKIAESRRMWGTSKTSYHPLQTAKVIIKHSKAVDEEQRGARSRNIDCIFIENAQGERFRFPFNYLHGARAMQMHVAKGGNPYDGIGESIVEQVANIALLRKFTSYANKMNMVDENTEPYLTGANQKIKDTKKLLTRLQNNNTYESATEELESGNKLHEDDVQPLVKLFTKEVFDEDLIEAFKLLPVVEFDDEDSKDRKDIMTQASTASRYAEYVDNWVSDPKSTLILKKDDSYDALQNNLRSQQKETDLKLMTILRDIATRFISADPQDDSIVNFASDMESQISQAGELFAKPDPETKRLKGTAIKLANKYLQDMKRIKQDDAYKDEVRKSPEDIKAFKNIKGQDVAKGKLAKQYKRKYKDESEQFEAWAIAQTEMLESTLDEEDIKQSEYQDAFAKPQKSADTNNIINLHRKLADI